MITQGRRMALVVDEVEETSTPPRMRERCRHASGRIANSAALISTFGSSGSHLAHAL